MRYFLICLILLGAGTIQGATTFDNLDNPVAGAQYAKFDQWIALRFQTDASAPTFDLESVSLNMGDALSAEGNFFVAVFTEALLRPSTSLGTLSGSSNPGTAGIYTYTASGITLSASTRYWIVAGVTSGSSIYAWTFAGAGDFNHSGTWSTPAIATNGASADQSGSWTVSNGYPYRASIAIPEANTWLLLVVALPFFLWRRKHA